MANETYKLIQTVTVGAGGASSIDFTSIPQTYTDLQLVVSGRSAHTDLYNFVALTVNNSTSGYSQRWLEGDGSNRYSYSGYTDKLRTDFPAANATSNTFGNASIYFPNYAGSTYKSVSTDIVYENNGTTAGQYISAGLWSNTAAITSIKLLNLNSSSWVQYSTASLYGITKAAALPAPKATGGTIIQPADGAYTYHVFTSSGTFTPTSSLTADVLTIAGGAGGGYWGTGGGGGGGGGGAGGVVYTSGITASSALTITVGAGGPAESNGSNSSVTGLTTAIGGGRGASNPNYPASTGGSGGGGSNGGNNTAYQNGAAGTSGQGYAGGNATTSSNYAGGGGGGGAAAVGQNGSSNGGNGGSGTGSYSSWSTGTGTGLNGYYAGGGGAGSWYGAGTGGAGGGGTGGYYPGSGYVPVAATDAVANTGSGGGGNSNYNGTNRAAGAGGSGIVIVRYAN